MSFSKNLREKRAQLVADAQALIPSNDAEFTAEARSKFDILMNEADAVKADIERAERSETADAELRSLRPISQPAPGAAIAQINGEEETRSFFEYLRTGVKRGLSVGGDGVIVPKALSPVIIDARKTYGNLANAVNNMTTNSGAPFTIPLSNDTANAFVETAEATALVEADGAFSSVTLTPSKFTTLVKISRELLQDAGYDLQSWLSNRFLARYFNAVAKAIHSGSTSGSVVSILTGAVVGETTAVTGAPIYSDLAAVYGSLLDVYVQNASWVMSSKTRAYIFTLTDNFGRPLMQPATDALGDRLFGKPVVIDELMDSTFATGTTPILFGDLKEGYTLRTVGGIEIIRSDEAALLTDEVVFVGRARIAGAPTNAGTNPIVSLKIK